MMSRTNVSPETAHSMARGLGWFSIGLGLAELLAPRALTRGLGMEGNEQIVQAYGVREIATGIGILSSNHPAPWIWGRVGGDALDIATLATGLQQDNPKKDNVELALVAVAGVTALDVVCGTSLARRIKSAASPPFGDRLSSPDRLPQTPSPDAGSGTRLRGSPRHANPGGAAAFPDHSDPE